MGQCCSRDPASGIDIDIRDVPVQYQRTQFSDINNLPSHAEVRDPLLERQHVAGGMHSGAAGKGETPLFRNVEMQHRVKQAPKANGRYVPQGQHGTHSSGTAENAAPAPPHRKATDYPLSEGSSSMSSAATKGSREREAREKELKQIDLAVAEALSSSKGARPTHEENTGYNIDRSKAYTVALEAQRPPPEAKRERTPPKPSGGHAPSSMPEGRPALGVVDAVEGELLSEGELPRPVVTPARPRPKIVPRLPLKEKGIEGQFGAPKVQ